MCSTYLQDANLFPPPPPQIPFLSSPDKQWQTSYLQVSANVSESLVMPEPLQVLMTGSLLLPKGWLGCQTVSWSAPRDRNQGSANLQEGKIALLWGTAKVVRTYVWPANTRVHVYTTSGPFDINFKSELPEFLFCFWQTVFSYINHYCFLLFRQVLLPLSQYLFYSFNIFRKH